MISTTRLIEALSSELVAALADDDLDGLADSGILEAALAAAETEVCAEVARAGYSPGEALPALLEDLAVTLAVERLLERRRDLLPGPWRERAARARTILAEIAALRFPVPGLTQRAASHHTPDSEANPPLHRAANLRRL